MNTVNHDYEVFLVGLFIIEKYYPDNMDAFEGQCVISYPWF